MRYEPAFFAKYVAHLFTKTNNKITASEAYARGFSWGLKKRDAAIRAAKGGSVLRRIARAAKWFAIGAAAGAVAAKATR
jgi:hypothetical protein